MRAGEELVFEIFGRRLAAKAWGAPDGKPVLALHGWLDNANTFDRLAPCLGELNLVALDFAGHGRSDHRPPGVHYHSFTDIQDVVAVADQLGWSRFSLIGHSMGASVASELAAMFPERIERAVHIDGFLATGGISLADRVAQNREALERMLKPATRGPKVYADTDDMARRVTQATDQSFDAASTLVQRGHKRVAGGVTWCADPRVRYPTPLRHTRETINLLLEGSLAPALLIVAEQGDKWYQGEIDAALAHHPKLTVARVDGPHHVHLEPAYVAEVARLTRRFFGLDDSEGLAA